MLSIRESQIRSGVSQPERKRVMGQNPMALYYFYRIQQQIKIQIEMGDIYEKDRGYCNWRIVD